ncbi:hypothetical protein [Leptothermofonsia sichuanensis]|uniref:hypothetical protein n=1 Tax=Leptothermofonsia sichuanensis TaxID=2917832 RepID=UPI001CED5B81|nr:hypothetical protein [Leptothermofonsia sichuanensis]
MTEPMGRQDAINHAKHPAGIAERCSLNYEETYICPVCRHGQIATLPLMDAFACNFCRHIFTADLRTQSIRVEDSSQPMTWRWNGRNWQGASSHMDMDLTVIIWLVGIALIVLPPGLIWLSSHAFPPMQGSAWYWFPTIWVGLAFLSHFLFVAWLLVEHYQFPLYVTCKIRLQDWLSRR